MCCWTIEICWRRCLRQRLRTTHLHCDASALCSSPSSWRKLFFWLDLPLVPEIRCCTSSLTYGGALTCHSLPGLHVHQFILIGCRNKTSRNLTICYWRGQDCNYNALLLIRRKNFSDWSYSILMLISWLGSIGAALRSLAAIALNNRCSDCWASTSSYCPLFVGEVGFVSGQLVIHLASWSTNSWGG